LAASCAFIVPATASARGSSTIGASPSAGSSSSTRAGLPASVRAIAETGVDYISSGAITHSAPNLDIGLDF
jgi:hypothetical protein